MKSAPVKEPKIHSIRYNALMNALLSSSSILFPLISVPYVSRVLSTYGLGAVAFAQSVVGYFSIVALFGVNTYGVRECAKVRDDPRQLSCVVKELMIVMLLTTSIVFVAYIGALLVVPRFQEEPMLYLMFGIALWLTSFGAEWFFQAIEQYDYITVRSVITKIIGLVLMFAFIRSSDDYVLYGWIIILTGYGSNIINIVRLRKLCDLSIKQELHPLRHIKPMAWFALASSASSMYTQTDIILLGFLATTSGVGIYQLVSKIESLLKTIVNSLGNVLLPRMSYYSTNDREDELANLMAVTINFIAVLGTLVVVLCTIGAREIVGILGGDKFFDAAYPLIANGPAVFFAAVNIPLGSYMIAKSGEKAWARANTISLAASYVIGIPLVSILGLTGAGLTISATEGISLILRRRECSDLFVSIQGKTDVTKSILLGVISGVAVWAASLFIPADTPLMVSLVVKGIVFCLLYTALLVAFHESITESLVRKYLRLG